MRELKNSPAIVYKHLDTRTGKTLDNIYYAVLNDWGSISRRYVDNILKRFCKEGLAKKELDDFNEQFPIFYKLIPTQGT